MGAALRLLVTQSGHSGGPPSTSVCDPNATLHQLAESVEFTSHCVGFANSDADRRHTVRRFVGHDPGSFCLLYPNLPGCVSEYGRSIPLPDLLAPTCPNGDVPTEASLHHRYNSPRA